MKTMTALLIAMTALAAQAETYFVGSQQVSKLEAFTAIIKDPNTKLLRCQEAELSPKMTIRNKKATRTLANASGGKGKGHGKRGKGHGKKH